MNITLENIDAVNAVITAEVAPADYSENVKKAIKDFRKKAKFPGFRPGMVPEGLIRKQYGTSILAEEVNKVLQQELFKYIQDNKVNMLGEPIPTEENNNIQLVEGNTFTFKFELAIAPAFDVELSKKDKIEYYNVEVSDEMVQNQINMYRQRNGKYDKVEAFEDKDMVKGIITELDVENGLNAEDVVMLPQYFKNDDQKAIFNGSKVNDVVKFNPFKAYDGSETELSAMLKIEKEPPG